MEGKFKKMSSADLKAHLQDIEMFAGQIGKDSVEEKLKRAHDKEGNLTISPKEYEELQRFKEELKGVNERVAKQLSGLKPEHFNTNVKPVDANGKPKRYCPGCFEFRDECKNTKQCQEFKL